MSKLKPLNLWRFRWKLFSRLLFVRSLIYLWCGKIVKSFERVRLSITSFVQNQLLNFFYQALNQTLPMNRKIFSWKTSAFDNCIRILIVQNFRRSAINFASCRHSNWCFSVITGFFSSKKTSVAHSIVLAEDLFLVWKLNYFEPLIRVLIIRKFRKFCLILTKVHIQI